MKKSQLSLGFIIFILFIPHIPFFLKGIDSFHSWRQSDTASTARNFYKESGNIFYPRIDIRGDKTGITGMEFPLYQYVVSLLYRIFQTDGDFFGLMVSWSSYLLIFLFLKSLFPNIQMISLLQSFSLTVILFQWAHKFMPESFGLSLCLGGLILYFRGYIAASSILLLLGALVRPFFIFFYFPMVRDVFFSALKRIILWKQLFAGIASLGIFSTWYFLWNPHLIETYGINYFYTGNFAWKNLLLFFDYKFYLTLIDALLFSYINPLLIVPFVLGIVSFYKVPEYRIFFYTCLIPLFVIPIVSRYHFVVHPYYLLTFAPLLVTAQAVGLDIVKKQRLYLLSFFVGLGLTLFLLWLFGGFVKFAKTAVILPLGLGLIFYLRHLFLKIPFFKTYESPLLIGHTAVMFLLICSGLFQIRPRNSKVLQSTLIAPKIWKETKETELFLTNDAAIAFYKTRRKGWRLSTEELLRIKSDHNKLRLFYDKGARWILFFNGTTFDLISILDILKGTES